MQSLASRLAGKKTYIVALATALLAVAGLWLGVLSITDAAALLTMAGGLVGIGAKIDRHHDELVAVLTRIADRGQQARSQTLHIGGTMSDSDVKGVLSNALSVADPGARR